MRVVFHGHCLTEHELVACIYPRVHWHGTFIIVDFPFHVDCIVIQLLKEKLIKESAVSDSWIKETKPTWFLFVIGPFGHV